MSWSERRERVLRTLLAHRWSPIDDGAGDGDGAPMTLRLPGETDRELRVSAGGALTFRVLSRHGRWYSRRCSLRLPAQETGIHEALEAARAWNREQRQASAIKRLDRDLRRAARDNALRRLEPPLGY